MNESPARWHARVIPGLLGAALFLAAAPRPAAGQATRPAPPRPVEQIEAEVEKVRREVLENQPPMEALFDPAKRAAAAPKALPPMRRLLPLLDEFAAADPRTKAGMLDLKIELTSVMALLGDADALAGLKKMAQSGSRYEAVGAQAWVYLVDWAKAAKDPAGQEKVLAEFERLARANIDHEMLTQVASLLCDQAATPALTERAENIVLETLQGPMAKELGASLINRRKLRALEGKPLVVTATAADGKPFTTADWKGKVVLVDFWATWCPPCMAGLPKLKKTYADLHARGLEIVGVSNDRDPDNFRAFLQDNKDMPWPQLIDPAPRQWHPLIDRYGVESLPTMFVIDRKGICRSVRAEGNYEEQVAKLLAERAE